MFTPVVARLFVGLVAAGAALSTGAVDAAGDWVGAGAVGVTALELADAPEVPPPLVAVEEKV